MSIKIPQTQSGFRSKEPDLLIRFLFVFFEIQFIQLLCSWGFSCFEIALSTVTLQNINFEQEKANMYFIFLPELPNRTSNFASKEKPLVFFLSYQTSSFPTLRLLSFIFIS